MSAAARRKVALHRAARQVACPACGAEPGEGCRTLKDERHPTTGRLISSAGARMADHHQARTKAVGGLPSTNGRVGAGDAPTDRRLYGQPAPAGDPGQPSWLLEPAASGATRREVHLHPDATADLKIVVSSRAVETIVADVAPVGDLVESGGILLGLRRSGVLLVTDAGGHGERAERKPMSYKHDAVHDIQLAQQLGQWAGLEEIGGWHSHGTGTDRPSPQDLQAWAGMAELVSKFRQTDPYLGLIVTAPRLRGSLARSGWQNPTLAAWITELGGVTSSRPWYRCRRAKIELAG
ncbi:MAG: zinc finger domain-containing protein [Solirubrobacteraceae bacterium]